MDEVLTRLEQLRRKAVTAELMVLPCVAALIGFMVLFNVGFGRFSSVCVPGFFLSTVGIFFFGIRAGKTVKAYATQYKQDLVRSALCDVFTDVTFEPERGIPESVVKDTGMMYTGDRYSSNDLVTGKYHGVGFVQSDVHIEEEQTDSDGHSSYYTVFRGRWMIFEFHKKFCCDLQVVSKYFSGSKRKGGIFSKKENRLHKIELENQVFNRNFKVFAQSQEEAFYLLTPHIMEAILKLEESINGQLMLMFVDGCLHIAVNNGKDAFEPHIFRKLDLQREKAAVVSDIRLITDFVDELRLDLQIYK